MRRPQTLLTDKLRLVRELGHGGMGELWIAEHLALRTEVVVKFISSEASGRPGAAERFAREAAAAARVNSPHVVRVLDYGASEDGAPFIVMEKLEGRDLGAELAARGRIEPATVVRIVQQLAHALSKAHSAGVVHRDVKPSNVFVCDTGGTFVKLLDFGVAKTSEAERAGVTASGVCVGTPGYMSPEQLLGSRDVDARADLWSLGVLAFHCLTGRKPFDGETAGAIALAIHTLPLPLPTEHGSSLPPAVDAWFMRACAREREQRFESALALAEGLSTALGVPLEASPPAAPAATPSPVVATVTSGPAPVRARWPRAMRAVLVAIAVGTVFAVGGPIYAQLARSHERPPAPADAVVATAPSGEPAATDVPAVIPSPVPVEPPMPAPVAAAPRAPTRASMPARIRTSPAPKPERVAAPIPSAAPPAPDPVGAVPEDRRAAPSPPPTDAAAPSIFVTPDVRR